VNIYPELVLNKQFKYGGVALTMSGLRFIVTILLAFAVSFQAASVADGSELSFGLHRYSLVVDGQQRTYAVYEPPSYDGQKALPVVIILHGTGGTGTGIIDETGWGEKASKEGFLAVFPDGMRVNPAAPPSLLTNPQTWNDGSARGSKLLPLVDDVKFLRLLVEDLSKKYVIDRKSVFGTGFSSGASLLFRVANEAPDLFAAIAPVAGHYWPTPFKPPAEPVPTLLIVGTADPVNPMEGGTVRLPWGTFVQPPVINTIIGWAKRNGWQDELTYANFSGGKCLEVTKGEQTWYRAYIVDGLGHMWPGGEAIFSANFIGSDPKTLPATEVIWDFFAQVRSWRR